FDQQRARLYRKLVEHFLNDAGDLSVELRWRKIHGHREFPGTVLPLRELFARLAQHNRAQIADEVRLFRDRKELTGKHQSSYGMIPARERLEATDDSRSDFHDRLVERLDLAGRK